MTAFTTPSASRRVVASDGTAIHVSHYPASADLRGVIVAAHGIQSHAGWFDATSRQCAAAGYEVWFADRRGSGRSGGDRGHARGAGRLLRDFADVADAARRERPAVPVVGWGVCWGGKIAAAAAAGGGWDALVLLYPGLFPRLGPNRVQKLKLALAGAVGIQRRPVPLPLTSNLFSDNPRWQAAMDADPLAVREATVGLLRAGVALESMARRAGCPTRVVLAGSDRVIHNRRTLRWLASGGGASDFETVPGATHVIEFDRRREAVTSRTLDWLNAATGRL